MTPPNEVPAATLRAPVKLVDRAEDLCLIGTEDIGGVIWQRQIPDDFPNWMDDITPQNLPSVRAIVPPHEMRVLITEICDTSKMPEGPNLEWFKEDVCHLAETFSQIMSAPYLQLRFDVVSDDACRKFHIDMVRARLICTYRGRGTQYGVPCGENDPDQVFNVRTGDPIVLRGRRWPTKTAEELRHRSPPIAGTGETRLILVLDSVACLDDTLAKQISEPKRRIGGSRSEAMPIGMGS